MAEEMEVIDGGAESPPSIRESLTAAMAAEGVQNAAPIPATPAETPAPSAPARAADGKFAKAPEAAQTLSPELKAAPAAGAEPLATPETIRPPASWSATAKADFAALAPHIQQEVLKREGEIETGKAQWDQKAQRFNRLDAILSPRQERFKLAGIDETQAVQALFAAQDMLESPDASTRANAIRYLARQSGVDLRGLVQGDPQQQPQAQLPPAVQQMAQEIASLKQTLSQQQQFAHQQSVTETQARIDAFAADPANKFFSNVERDMGALINAGQATGLKDAYEKAVWAHPEIRPILLREQQAVAVAEQERAARARVEAARKASGSIIGSPSPGSSAPGAAPAPSIRAELERQFTGV